MKLLYKLVFGLVLFSIIVTMYQIIFLGLDISLFKKSSVRHTELEYSDLEYYKDEMTREEAINYNLINQVESKEYQDYIRDYLKITGPEYFELILGIHYAESFGNSDGTSRNYYHPSSETYKAGDLMKDTNMQGAIDVNGQDTTWIGALGLNRSYIQSWGFKKEVEWTIKSLDENLGWVKDKEHLKIAQPVSHNAGNNALYEVVLGGNSDVSKYLGDQTTEDDFRNELLEVLYNDITDLNNPDPLSISAEKITAHLVENHGWLVDPDACWDWSSVNGMILDNNRQIDQGLKMAKIQENLTNEMSPFDFVKKLDTSNLKYQGNDIKDSVTTKYGNMVYKDMGDGVYIVMNPQSLNHAAKTYFNGKYHYGLLLEKGKTPGVFASDYSTFMHSRVGGGVLASGITLQSGVYSADLSRTISNDTNYFKTRGYNNGINPTVIPGFGKIAFPLYVGDGTLVLTGEYGSDHDGVDFATAGLAAQLGISTNDIPVINSYTGVVTNINKFPFNYYSNRSYCEPEGFGAPSSSPIKADSTSKIQASVDRFREEYWKVITSGWLAYGNSVEILTDLTYNGNPVYIRYAHLYQILDYVNVGDRIETGAQIGYAGNTGHSSGPHLHFEMLVKIGNIKTRIDPLKYLQLERVG